MAFPSRSSSSPDVCLSVTGSETKQGLVGNISNFIYKENVQNRDTITASLLKEIQRSSIGIPALPINYASSSFILYEVANITEFHVRKNPLVLPYLYDLDLRHHEGSSEENLNCSATNASCIPLAFCTASYEYDVFLSFRGPDMRLGFTGNLYKALDDKGIHTFIDDEELPSGEPIKQSLIKAIQESRIAITVFSKNYAFSSACLDELATILDCAQRKGLFVLPVFYNVDPSDLKLLKGSYGKALAKHEERFIANEEWFKHNMEKLEKWKMALRQAANLSGFHFKHGSGYEYEFIGRIVELVSSKINRAPLHVADYPVGLDSQVLEVRELLDSGSVDGVHMIGIHGIGGLGKSTLARAVYNNLIAEKFDGLCFLDNVREESKNNGLKHLQSTLLSEILGEKQINLASVEKGASMIKNRLQRKKILLILDDVDKHEQLQAIVGRTDWFGSGSRIIITTQDKQLLVLHEVKTIYEVKELNKNDARQLLTWKAFKMEIVDPSYNEVLDRVVTYASGFPLALEIIGSNMFEKSIEEWKSAIDQYERIPPHKILEVLRVSFDALEEEEKSVFLDIICCFKGCELAKVEDMLHAHYGHSIKYHIHILVEKSLIKISEHGWVKLHDLIEDMGKEILRQQSPKELGKRTRLWLPEDIVQVLKDNTGTSEIEIICLDLPISDKEEAIEWNENAFNEMKNLKTLVIKNGSFSKGPNYLPESLRVLEWHQYPSHCLPSDFHPMKLTICKLTNSCIKSFESGGLSKKFVDLRVLNFDGCKCLTQIPDDISGLPNLEELSFRDCENLITVHDSIGFLDKLKILRASGCSKLMSFPAIKMISLEKLELSFCSSLESFPEILGKIEKLREVWLHGTPIKELSLSFQNLIGLQKLCMFDSGFVQIPSSIVMMPELTLIHTSRWKGWQWLKKVEGEEVRSTVSSKVKCLWASKCNLHDDFFSINFARFAHMEELYLSNNDLTILPECIKELQFLRILDVSGCKRLWGIRGIPPNLKHFFAIDCKSLTSRSTHMFLNQELHEAGNTLFYLPGERIPEWFDHRSREPSISFWFRNNFPDKVLCLLVAPMDECSGFLFPAVFINGKKCSVNGLRFLMGTNHTYLFDLRQIKFTDSPYKEPFGNKWNRVEVTCSGYQKTTIRKEIRIHIFKQKGRREDVLFTDPYDKQKSKSDLTILESQYQKLQKKVRFKEGPIRSVPKVFSRYKFHG